jgi:hypothetical protein
MPMAAEECGMDRKTNHSVRKTTIKTLRKAGVARDIYIIPRDHVLFHFHIISVSLFYFLYLSHLAFLSFVQNIPKILIRLQGPSLTQHLLTKAVDVHFGLEDQSTS